MVIYATACSGIDAPAVAWRPLGWTQAFSSDIEPFPNAVRAHHDPDVPNYGDMTKFREWPDHDDIGLICAGTPCQAFSVAGLRKGLDDPRGNLTLVFLGILDRYRPEWVVWENVPGVLSIDGGRVFGTFLGGLGQLGYGFAYRVLDAQHFGVPQRRRRVFVVGHLGDWRRAAAVLFERHSLQGHPAPSREKGERPAPAVTSGAANGSAGHESRSGSAKEGLIVPVSPTLRAGGNRTGGDRPPGTDVDTCDSLIPILNAVAYGGNNQSGPINVATAVNAHGGPHGRLDFESETFVTHSLRAEGFDASEDSTGRGTPLVPVAFDTTQITSAANYSNPKAGDPCHPLAARGHPPAIAFSSKDHGADAGDIAPTLRSMGHEGSHANGGGQVAVAFHNRQDPDVSGDVTHPIGAKDNGMGIWHGMQVRRLTPIECERLQGFPDQYTNVPYRGKPAADRPRYKALGNSMAVPVMRWIGERVQVVEDVYAELQEAA